jgi:hypothetical protein
MNLDNLVRAQDETRIGGNPTLGILYALIDIAKSQRVIAACEEFKTNGV